MALLGEVPTDEECELFTGHFSQLLAHCTNGTQRFVIMASISSLSVGERCFVVGQAVRLIAPTMDSHAVSDIVRRLRGMPTTECQDFVDHVLRLSHLPAYQTNGLEVIQHVARVRSEHRANFVTFVLRNGVTDLRHIGELSQVPSGDWPATLAAIRERERITAAHPGPRRVMAGQTVHDPAYEASVRRAITQLARRYGGRTSEDLDTITVLHISKVQDLTVRGLLTPEEAHIATFFFEQGQTRAGIPEELTRILNLNWHALHDADAAREMGFGMGDADERVSTWMKKGPINAQVAYLLDHIEAGIGRFSSSAELFAAAVTDPSILRTHGNASCNGGTINRLIDGLHLAHPDVQLEYGAGTIANARARAREHFLKKSIIQFIHDAYEANPSSLDDRDRLRRESREHLQTLVATERAKPNSDFVDDATQDINDCITSHFDKAIREATNLKSVQDYLQGTATTGLSHDLSVWSDKQVLLLATVEQAFETHAQDLMEGKLAQLNPPPSAGDADALKAEAVALAKTMAVKHKHAEWQKSALIVMSRVPEASKPSMLRNTLVDLVIENLKSQGVQEDTLKRTEVEGAILGNDTVRDQLYAKVTE
jgi:hypothetical protein